MAGLLIDGGHAFSETRQAQAAADTAALAAASAATQGTDPIAAAQKVAKPNGFYQPTATDCSGAALPGGGIQVNMPPTAGTHAGDEGYVEVVTTRAMQTGFAGVLGMRCWMVSARAVATIATTGVATCGLCVLGTDGTPETLGLSSNANVRVEGDVYVNQNNWTAGTAATNRCGTNPCRADTCNPTPWHRPGGNSAIETMCGQSFYLSNANGGTDLLSARSISVRGGWESYIQNRVMADQLAQNCVYHPTPYDWTVTSPTVQDARVCMGMPALVDPLNNPADLGNTVNPPDPDELRVPVAGQNGCPANARVPTGTLANPQRLAITGADTGAPYFTICPGIYYGGFSVVGDNRNVKVWMLPGIYYMVGGGASGGGGFVVNGTASIDGSAGVFIYLTGGQESFQESTSPSSDVPQCGTCGTSSAIISGNGNGLTSSDLSAAIGETITYTLNITGSPSPPVPTGSVTFYDGTDPISAACTGVALGPGTSPKVKASCSTSYSLFGTRGVTAVYSGDPVYQAVRVQLTGGPETINPPSGVQAGTFNICTGPPCGADGAQSMGDPINTVVLHAPTTGPYAGMLVWQDRQSGLGLKIWPYKGAPDCTGTWFTDTSPIPAPCGQLGGLSGTIYAPHLKDGSSGDHDASINWRAAGLGNVQIITGTATFAYPGYYRFNWQPSSFANGRIHLVE